MPVSRFYRQTCLGTAGAVVGGWPAGDSLRAHSIQSSPKSSHGWGVRIVPLAQPSRSVGQNLSQPQQMFSGCAGLTGILAMSRF